MQIANSFSELNEQARERLKAHVANRAMRRAIRTVINGRPSRKRLASGLAIAVTKDVSEETAAEWYKKPDKGSYIISFSRVGVRPRPDELGVAKGELRKIFPNPLICLVPDGPVDRVVDKDGQTHCVIRWFIEEAEKEAFVFGRQGVWHEETKEVAHAQA